MHFRKPAFFKNGKHRSLLLMVLVFAMFGGSLNPVNGWAAEGSREPLASPVPEASASPGQDTPTPEPSVSPSPTPVPSPTVCPDSYQLLNKNVRYKKGGQRGIHYKKVKGKKVYQIQSYTTDRVSLSMSHPSVFRIYGGKSRKAVKKKYVTVSSKGVVVCHRRKKGEKQYVVVEAVSKLTGEKRYIYIAFRERLYCKTAKRITLYEKHSAGLTFNYGRKKLSFSVSNKKKLSVNAKGRVTGRRHGTAYVTAKVKDSQKNRVRIKVVVKIEPWIVSKKDTKYDYEDMKKDLTKLHAKYPVKTTVFSLGKTADKRDIWCIRIGKASAGRKLVIDAAIHAREWKNVQVMMRQAEDMLRDYREYKERFKKTCIYIIPMDNPDGVTLSQYGFGAIRNKKLKKLCKKIGHARKWKANARGVDLNDNFPAGFRKKGMKKKPSYMSYPGKKAASEKETRALMRFINEKKPQAVLNVHSTGSIIYWDFGVEEKQHEKLNHLAEKIKSFNKYVMMPPSGSTSMAGGFADWLNYKKGITSVTIETGTVLCPLPHSQYKSIYKRNNKMFRWFMTKY